MSDWFDVQAVEPGIFVIEEPYHVERVKSQLIVGDERAILLDTGMGVADIHAVAISLTDKPITVVNSHAHWDHIGGNHLFDEILIHRAESAMLLGGVGNGVLRPWFQPDKLTGPLPDGVTAETIAIPPSKAVGFLADGDVLDIGGRVLDVMHCPGHSPGGIVLLDRASGVLFSTDVAYGGALYVYAEADLPIYQQSLARLAALAPELRVVYPCHGDSVMSPTLLPAMADALTMIVAGGPPAWVEDESAGWIFSGFSVELRLGGDA